MSNRQNKILQRKEEQALFLKEKRIHGIEKRWENAQLRAASANSVLEYMVKVFEESKDKVNEEIRLKTEEEIKLRKKELEEFLMSEKNLYLKEKKDYDASI